MTLQLVLLMEQLIQESKDNSSLSIPEDYNALLSEYNRFKNLKLTNTKNAQIILERLNSIENIAQTKEKAIELIRFIKSLRNHFGKSSILVGTNQFNELCKKYNLVTGLLSRYTGIIPESNLKEIELAVKKVNSFSYKLNVVDSNYLWSISEIDAYSSIASKLSQWLEDNYNLVISNTPEIHFDGGIWGTDVLNNDFPEHWKTPGVVLRGQLITKKDMLIACPPEQLQKQSIEITKRAVDPIVFQYSSYGVIIHSIWGEESEDKVFEEYKKVNNLLTL